MQAIAGLGMVVILAWPQAQEAGETARSVLRDDAYQRTLPVGEAPKAPKAPESSESSSPRDWRGGASASGQSSGDSIGTASGLVTTLAWIVGGVVLAAGLFVSFREWPAGRGSDGREGVAESAAQAPRIRLDAGALGDAEALARAGRFVDAIHVLLLRTFEAIGRRARLPTSLTSREILAQVPMSDAARGALGELVTAVEISHFGGQGAVEADFELCLERYRAVLEAEGVSAA